MRFKLATTSFVKNWQQKIKSIQSSVQSQTVTAPIYVTGYFVTWAWFRVGQPVEYFNHFIIT